MTVATGEARDILQLRRRQELLDDRRLRAAERAPVGVEIHHHQLTIAEQSLERSNAEGFFASNCRFRHRR